MKRLAIAIGLLLSRLTLSIANAGSMQALVGRGGLEPPTSAVTSPERCASRVATPSVRRGVIRPGNAT